MNLHMKIILTGHVLVDDVMFTKSQYESMFGNGTLDRNAHPGRKWPNGIIPYTIASNFDAYHKNRILEGIAYVNENLKDCIVLRYFLYH